MSMDLKLVILDKEQEGMLKSGGLIFPANTLCFKQNYYTVFSQLRQIEGNPKPKIRPHRFPKGTRFYRYDDNGGKEVEVDDYENDPLTFVYAKQLRNWDVGDDPFHLAIKAYLLALPGETRILLYWS